MVIPQSLHQQVLQLLQLMKQLACTAVCWPRIDADIAELCRSCNTCAEHQNKAAKADNHPWILPEKPWSRIHLDYAINFLGSNWLVIIDTYSNIQSIRFLKCTTFVMSNMQCNFKTREVLTIYAYKILKAKKVKPHLARLASCIKTQVDESSKDLH